MDGLRRAIALRADSGHAVFPRRRDLSSEEIARLALTIRAVRMTSEDRPCPVYSRIRVVRFAGTNEEARAEDSS